MPYERAECLDHVYNNIGYGYKITTLSHLGQSDHLSLFLTPVYKPLIRKTKPSVRTIKTWLVFLGGNSEIVWMSWRRCFAASLISYCQCALSTIASSRPLSCLSEKMPISNLNVYRPVALTSNVMKCFERVVLRQIKLTLSPTLDQHQSAYGANRSTDDASQHSSLHCDDSSGAPGNICEDTVCGL